jgi:hypothetical protein
MYSENFEFQKTVQHILVGIYRNFVIKKFSDWCCVCVCVIFYVIVIRDNCDDKKTMLLKRNEMQTTKKLVNARVV